MTARTATSGPAGKSTKPPGWFSRRHETSEAHQAARERYLASHGRTARREKAAKRQSAHDVLTLQQKIARARPGSNEHQRLMIAEQTA